MSLRVPYSARLPFTPGEGKEIIIKGEACPDCNRFSINLCEGSDYNSDTALHFNPRFDQDEVVRAHRSGDWGPEERGGGLPFQKGSPYEVRIVTKNHAFEIFVNNNHFCDFNHRISKENARNIYIEGDTTLKNVSFVDSVKNPPVPFTHAIYGGLYPGRTIEIHGVPTGGSRFHVNLLCGPNFADSDIAFHMDGRFKMGDSENIVVRNHRQGGDWGDEEKHQDRFPFTVNGHFELRISVEHDKFRISVNNQHFTDFHHRIKDLQRINHVNVQGDVNLVLVKL